MRDEDLVDVLRLDACRSEIPHERAPLERADLYRPHAGIDQYALLAGPYDEAAVLEHDVAVVVQPALVLLPLLVARAAEVLRPLERDAAVGYPDDFEITDHELRCHLLLDSDVLAVLRKRS